MLSLLTISPVVITVIAISCCLAFALLVLLLFLCGNFIIDTPKQLKRIADALEMIANASDDKKSNE